MMFNMSTVRWQRSMWSEAENGGGENRVERAWQKTMERSGERAENAAHSPLQPNIPLTS